MKKIVIAVGIAIVIASSALWLYAKPKPPSVVNDPELGEISTWHINIILKPGVPASRAFELAHEVDGTVVDSIPEVRFFQINLFSSKGADDVKRAIRQLSSHPEVESASPARAGRLH